MKRPIALCVHVLGEDEFYLQIEDEFWPMLAFWPESHNYLVVATKPLTSQEFLDLI